MRLAEKVLKLYAGKARAPLMLAGYPIGKDQHQQALQILKSALVLNPNDRPLNLLKISTHNALRQSTEAVAVFNRLVSHEPADIALYQAFAKPYLTMGAVADFADGENPEVQLTLQVYAASGQPALAQDFYLRAVKITHDEELFTAEYARLLVKTGPVGSVLIDGEFG